jgi:ubiquinone/menaquinone biosynthesis C-methylase UbiE
VLKRAANFLRPALVLAAVFFGFGFVIIAYQGVRTLQQLSLIEAERDQWQHSAEIIQTLKLSPGSTVADLGCGSGYFALKLSATVDSIGTVYAIDIRRLPLAVLWTRSLIGRRRNIDLVLGEPNNPHLPPNSVSAVLIANTYHELDNRGAVLNQLFRSLVPGGRLVIADPEKSENKELRIAMVEEELKNNGFEIVRIDSQFLQQPGRGPWWLIVARKP